MIRTSQQLFVMKILPEEDITGFVVRQSFERSLGGIFVKRDKTGAAGRPGWAFPSGLASLVTELGEGLPDIDGVVEGHTRYPLHAPFLAPAEQRILRGHYQGQAEMGIAARVGMASWTLRSRLAVCGDCIQTDSRENGYSIWRRLHLMPGVLACPIHKRPLLTFCFSCESGHRRMRTNWRPGSRCMCGDSLRPVEQLDTKELEVSIGMADMADQILRNSPVTCISALSITAAFAHHFGGSGPNAQLRLKESLTQGLGLNAMARLAIGSQTIARFLGNSCSAGFIRNPLQNLAAVYAVCGGAVGFAELLNQATQSGSAARNEVEVIDVKLLERRKSRALTGQRYLDWVEALSPNDRFRLKTKSRRWLLNLLAQEPSISRSALALKPGNYSALRYLRNVDNVWFDDLVPVERSRRQRVADELSRLREVELLLTHIRRRYELALTLRPWERITKTFLLTGVACESSLSLAIASNEIQAVLSMCAESPAVARRRRTEMICAAVQRRSPGHPLGDKESYDRLTDRDCVRRIFKGRKWVSQNQD